MRSAFAESRTTYHVADESTTGTLTLACERCDELGMIDDPIERVVTRCAPCDGTGVLTLEIVVPFRDDDYNEATFAEIEDCWDVDDIRKHVGTVASSTHPIETCEQCRRCARDAQIMARVTGSVGATHILSGPTDDEYHEAKWERTS